MCIQRAYQQYIICKAKAIAATLQQIQLVAAITVLQSLHRMNRARTRYISSLRRQNRAAVHIQRICRGGAVRIRRARQLQAAAAVAIQQNAQQQEHQEQQQIQMQQAAAVVIQKAVLCVAQVRRNSKQLHLQGGNASATGHVSTGSPEQQDALPDSAVSSSNTHQTDSTSTAADDDTTVQRGGVSQAMTMQQVCPTHIGDNISADTDTSVTDLSDEYMPLSEKQECTTNMRELTYCPDGASGMKSSDNSDKLTVPYTAENRIPIAAATSNEGGTSDMSCIATTAVLLSTSSGAVITVLQCNTCGHHADLNDSSNGAVQLSTANTNALDQCCHCGGNYMHTTVISQQQQEQSDSANGTRSVENTGFNDDNCFESQQQQLHSEPATEVLPLQSSLAAPVIAVTLTAAEKIRRSQLDMHAHRIQRQFKRYQQQQSQQLQARTVLMRWLLHHIHGRRARAQYLYKLKCVVVVQACIRRHAAITSVNALRQARLQHWLALTSHISCPLTELMSSDDDDWHSNSSNGSSSDSSSSRVIANIDDIANKHELHIQRMLLGHDCHTIAPYGCDVTVSALQSLIRKDIELVLNPVCAPDTLVIDVVKHTVDTTASL
jgi:hypothetical protein